METEKVFPDKITDPVLLAKFAMYKRTGKTPPAPSWYLAHVRAAGIKPDFKFAGGPPKYPAWCKVAPVSDGRAAVFKKFGKWWPDENGNWAAAAYIAAWNNLNGYKGVTA